MWHLAENNADEEMVLWTPRMLAAYPAAGGISQAAMLANIEGNVFHLYQ